MERVVVVGGGGGNGDIICLHNATNIKYVYILYRCQLWFRYPEPIQTFPPYLNHHLITPYPSAGEYTNKPYHNSAGN